MFLSRANSGRLTRVTTLDRWRRPWRGERAFPSALAAVWLCARSAIAAELWVTGPAACPDAGDLAFRVERSIGVPLAQSAPLRFSVVFEAPVPPETRYTARLSAPGPERSAVTPSRAIHARDCGRLGDAVSVAIALAIRSPDATAASATEPDETHSASTSVSGSVSATSRSPAEANPPAAMDRSASEVGAAEATASDALAPALAAFLLADSGSLPRAGVGMGLGLELRAARLALRVQGALLFEQHVAVESGAGAPGADMNLVFGSVSGCWAPAGSFHSSFAAFACAGWELGQLWAAGTGVREPLEGSQLWTAPRADGGLSWLIGAGWLRGTLQLSALAPMKRDDFFLRQVGNVHRPPGAVGRLTLGLDIAFE
jgi:hypothetical protein